MGFQYVKVFTAHFDLASCISQCQATLAVVTLGIFIKQNKRMGQHLAVHKKAKKYAYATSMD